MGGGGSRGRRSSGSAYSPAYTTPSYRRSYAPSYGRPTYTAPRPVTRPIATGGGTPVFRGTPTRTYRAGGRTYYYRGRRMDAPEEPCVDVVDWKDAEGHTCAEYEENLFWCPESEEARMNCCACKDLEVVAVDEQPEEAHEEEEAPQEEASQPEEEYTETAPAEAEAEAHAETAAATSDEQ